MALKRVSAENIEYEETFPCRVIPGDAHILAELEELAKGEPKFLEYIRSNRVMHQWGYVVDSFFFEELSRETETNYRLMNEEWTLHEEENAPELNEAGVMLVCCAVSGDGVLRCLKRVWELCPVLWKYMIRQPQAVRNIISYKQEGDSVKQFMWDYICYWTKQTNLPEVVLRDISKCMQGCMQGFDDQRMKLVQIYEELYGMIREIPVLRRDYAASFFRRVSYMKLRAEEIVHTGFFRRTTGNLLEDGEDMVMIALDNWCEDTSETAVFIRYFTKRKSERTKITVTKLNERINHRPYNSYNVQERFAGTLWTLVECLEIENDNSAHARWLLQTFLDHFSEEEMIQVKRKGIFHTEEIQSNMLKLLEKGEIDWVPFLLQWCHGAKEQRE